MILERGSRLGPYEIVAPLDAGGMGEVYRAVDTRLDRPVAIKVLAARLSGDPHRHARFQREAKAISALTHPNVCQIFDVGTHGDTPYLVMEYLEGQPLMHRLMGGPLPPGEAIRIGAEIAAALGAAHARHIVHHDVKPSNILLTPSGSKLLDFGLAREVRQAADTDTLSSVTDQGAIAGTLGYMAPEQLEGRGGDPRTDIWGLGAVLYEMVTGQAPFGGPSRADVMAAILTRTPDLDAIPAPPLRRVVGKCLSKDPNDRWQSAADLAEQLRSVQITTPHGIRLRVRVAAALAGLAILATVVIGWDKWNAEPPPAERLSIALPAGSRYTSDTRGLAIAPDGRRVVFRVDRDSKIPEVYLRNLDDFELKSLGPSTGADLTFSPDGRWLAVAGGLQLFKAPAEGGQPIRLATFQTNSRGISWGPTGTIYFAGLDEGIFAVSAEGSDYRAITTPDPAADENSHRTPYALPDGKHLLFTVRTGRISSFDDARIAVLSLKTGQWRTVLERGFHPSYVPSGHLVFVRQNALWAAPFDLGSLTVTGEQVRLVSGVMADTSTGIAQYAVAADTGTLIYVPGEARPERSEFQLLSRQGTQTRTFVLPKVVDQFRVSPDEKLVAVQASAANDDIFSYDMQRDVLTRVTSEPGNEYTPAWTHDGTAILFSSRRGLHRQRLDGASPPELLVAAQPLRIPNWAASSPDGTAIAYALPSRGDQQAAIHLLATGPVGHDRSPPAAFVGFMPQFSPCGRWMAFVTFEAGRHEVHVRHLTSGRRIQISRDGGTQPRWSRDGRELYYRYGDSFFVVPVAPPPSTHIGGPQLMFRRARIRNWDVLAGGFLLLESIEQPLVDAGINVVPRWADEVRARAGR
jgi:Tol biopolymer transport system component